MKRCPKCNRSYPDDNQKFCTIDGGLLIAASQAFDPNATIASSRPLGEMPTDELVKEELRDLAETIAITAGSTGGASRPTGPTGSETVYDMGAQRPAPPPTPPPSPPIAAALPAPVSAMPPAKKSKLPLILGILLLLLLLGAGAVVALFFVVIKPRLDDRQADRRVVITESNNNTKANDNNNTSVEKTTTDDAVAPPNTVLFANSSSNLDGKLAEHYIDFSFSYPNTWQTDPKAGVPGASNFIKVERRIPPDFTQENFAVGWYTSKGTFEADEPTFPQLVEILGANLARGFPEYRKVSEGPTKVNSLDAYEFRFVSVSKGTEKGDIDLWGRVIFLPSGVSGERTGATLSLLATSLAPELSGVDDVGEKGETPVILESFRFGRKP